MSALQRQVADATLRRSKEEDEASGRRGYPWPAEAWKKAEEAILDGTWKERRRPTYYPILLTADGPISTASELQKLAQMATLPEVIETSQVDIHDQEIKKVTICCIDHDERDRIEERADVSHGITEGITVIFEGRRRFARIVTTLKAGVTLGNEDKDEDKDEDEDGSIGGEVGEEVTASPELAEPKPGLDGESEK
jgi:hypothetical protein